MTYSLHQHERKAPRPVYKEAQVYYNDFNAEKRSKKFTQKTHEFNFICKATDSSIPITRKEQDLLADISNIIKASSKGLAYLSHTELSNLTGNNKRQNNIMRKNLSHVLRSKWKKKVKIDGAVMSKVIIFKYTTNGEVILNNPKEYYEKVKAGTRVPISIYKDEKDIKDRSSVQAHESSFLQNSISFIPEETIAQKETSKVIPLKYKPICNKRKKNTHQERKARVYTPKFNQYQQPKTLSEHYPLTQEDCLKLQTSSGRPFTLNAMNEILLDISRKPKESTHLFPSKAAFMAYMGKLYRYEGRDAVKTANLGFKILARATKAEVVAYTTQTQREDFMATFEEMAINCPTPENRFKAKIACTLPPMIGYNLLSSIKSVLFSGNRLEIHLANQLNINHHEQAILKEAMAVDAKITALSVCC
jgi:hypothetical protein